MAQLTIPQSQESAVERLVGLSDEEFDRLLTALASASPTLHMNVWAKRLSPVIGLDEEQ